MNNGNDTTPRLPDNSRIFSTVRVSLIDRSTCEVVDALYDKAAEYKEDIAQAMSSFISPQYPTRDLMHYFSLPNNRQMEDTIKAKIQSATPTVHAVQKTLYAVLDLTMSSDLTDDEYAAFTEQIETQYQDGWGAEFELLDIPTGGNDAVCLRLYHQDIEFYTTEGFKVKYGLENKVQPLTVKEFVAQHPDADICMMTPGGYVHLTPETSQALLEGKSTFGHPGDPEMAVEIDAEELLPQTIFSDNYSNGVWYLGTEYSQDQLNYELYKSQDQPDVEQGMTLC